MYYPLKNNTLLNVVLLVPDNLPEAVAKAPGDLEEMHEIFKDWDPRYVDEQAACRRGGGPNNGLP